MEPKSLYKKKQRSWSSQKKNGSRSRRPWKKEEPEPVEKNKEPETEPTEKKQGAGAEKKKIAGSSALLTGSGKFYT